MPIFQKYVWNILRPEELLRGPRDIIGRRRWVRNPFVPPRHNRHARGATRSFFRTVLRSDAPPSIPWLAVPFALQWEKKKEIFCTIDRSRTDESRYRGHVSLSVASPSTTNAVYIRDFLRASFTVYLHFTPFDSHSLAYFLGRNINGTNDIAVDVHRA